MKEAYTAAEIKAIKRFVKDPELLADLKYEIFHHFDDGDDVFPSKEFIFQDVRGELEDHVKLLEQRLSIAALGLGGDE